MSTRYRYFHKSFSIIPKQKTHYFVIGLNSASDCQGLTFEPGSNEWTLRSSDLPRRSSNSEQYSLLKSCFQETEGASKDCQLIGSYLGGYAENKRKGFSSLSKAREQCLLGILGITKYPLVYKKCVIFNLISI